MKSVSRQYKESMAKEFRNRSHCVITFGNSDISAITDGTWSGDTAYISSFESIDFEHAYNDTIATLELNRWSLDGKNSIKRENDGYVGYAMGEEVLRKTFSTTHNFSGITLTFDTRENEWPFAVKLEYYSREGVSDLVTENNESIIDDQNENIIVNGSIQTTNIVDEIGNDIVDDGSDEIIAEYEGDSLLQSIVVYPTSTVCPITLSGTNVDSIVITFLSVLPSRRPRLEHISWGVSAIFNDSRIVSVQQTHDVDPVSRRLPDERLTFVITDFEHQYDPDNPQGIYATINKGAPVCVSYGYDVDKNTTEWVKADRYSLLNDPVFRDNKVTFNCVGLINTLTDYYYKDVYNPSGKSLYSLAQAVLSDAGLPLTPDGHNPWEIDTSLQSMMTTAVLPVDTHANLLQMIAHAARCRLSTDDDNIIHIKPFGVTPIGIFDGVYSDSGHANISEWGSVDYGNSNSQNRATLELNKWALDGSNTLFNYDNGYVSDSMSSSTGVSSDYWQKEFYVSHNLPIVTLAFDDVGKTWPLKLTVEYYGGNGLISTSIVYPNKSTISINAESVTGCTRIKVTSNARIPYTRSRLSKVAFRETDFSIKLDDIKHKTNATSKIEKLKNVNVCEYSYIVGDSSELFNGETNLEFLHIEYSASHDISVSVTGGTVIDQDIYAQACDLTLSEGTKQIVITGKPIDSVPKVHTLIVGNTGDDDIEENPLISNATMAEALANQMKTYLSLRNTYDADYRGNPELEVGDIIELETPYTSVVYGLMLTDELNYNGALSGKVKVKGLL